MRATLASVVAAAAVLLPVANAAYPYAKPMSLDTFCKNPRVVSTSYTGANNDVRVDHTACDDVVSVSEIERRQTKNDCGSPFNTFCFTPSGGGPDPNECHVMTDALLYDAQNTGPLFTMDPANNTTVVTMTYKSCESFIVDQTGAALQYCRSDWASILDNLAFNCQSTQNAHGGLSVATNQDWFIQVQHS